MTVRFDDTSKPCVRVLMVGGPADGQWLQVAADTKHLGNGGRPLTPWVRIAHGFMQETHYDFHAVRNGHTTEWIGTPHGTHDPFQYFMSLYSTNALKAKR